MSNNKPLCSTRVLEMKRLPTDSESLASDFERYLTHHLGRSEERRVGKECRL